MKVSVVIPNYNGEKVIAPCLNSLRDQSFSDFEIIVVDDASTDSSLSVLKSYANICVLQNEKNVGFAASVNRGIKAACGEFVILLNNDVEVTSDFVERLYNSISENDKIFSVSSKMVRYYERELLDDTGDFYHLLGWAFKRGDGKSIRKYQRSSRVFSTCAGAGIYRRNVFDEIGLFDEHHFAYLEDVDISYRGLIYGYRNEYEPKAVCYHIGSATTAEGNKYSSFKVRLSARNNVYLVYKNMPFFQLIINLPFLIVGYMIKGLVFIKRGYGKDYWGGFKDGVKNLKILRKTPFKIKRTLNYLKIEAYLIINVFRHLISKLG